MENITKALYQAAGLLLFLSALTLLFMCVGAVKEMSNENAKSKSYKYEYSESADFSYIRDSKGGTLE